MDCRARAARSLPVFGLSLVAGLVPLAGLWPVVGHAAPDEASRARGLEIAIESLVLKRRPAGVRLEGVSTSADVEIGDWRIGPRSLAILDYDGEAKRIRLESLRFEAYGGKWEQAGTIVLEEPPSFDIEARVDGLDVDRLARRSPAGELSLLSGEARIRGRWTGEDDWLAPLAGSGRVEVRGGELPSQELLTSVARALMAYVPGIRSGEPDPSKVKRTRLDRLTASFAVRDGRAHTDDLDLITDDYRVTGRGSLGHDLGMDLDTRVKLTSAGLDKMLSMASLGRVGGMPLPAIPVRIRGAIGDPSFHVDLTAASVATLGLVPRGAGAAVRVTEGAAKALGDVGAAAGRLRGRGAAPEDHAAPAEAGEER